MRAVAKKTALFVLVLAMMSAGIAAGAGEGAEKTEAVELPIIMYHRVTKSISNPKYSVTPGELEQDLACLRELGYTTVTVSDLTAYVSQGGALPAKPVMLTFDDGESCLHRYVLPLLEKYDMRAVAAIIGATADKYSASEESLEYFPNLTWAQINEIAGSGRFEIQSHTYDLHKNGGKIRGALRKRGEGRTEYRERLSSDLLAMQTRMLEMTGSVPTALLYPFGLYSDESELLVRELGFKASMTCREGVNVLTAGEPSCLFALRRNNRPHAVNRRSFFAKIGIK